MKIDSNNISSTRIWFLYGQHYWADKIETYNSNDDVIIMSSDNQPDLSDVTISYIHTHDNSRGMLVNAKTTNGSVRRITICNSRFNDNGIRNWRWQASDEMHSFNNYVHDCSIGINGRITSGNVGSNTLNRAIIESSVFENVGNPLNIQNPGGSLAFQYDHWAYSDGLNDYGGGSIIGQVDDPSAPAAHTIPYSYIKLPTAQVKAHVLANAGVESL